MANLPEKNITTVDKITSVPSNTNLYINANGEFRQATVDDVLKASPVIADSITNQYKNANGSPILLTDSANGVAIDFEVYGRSTQTQGNFYDGELQQGGYSYSNGAYAGSSSQYISTKNRKPCKEGDIVAITVNTDVVEGSGILWYANGVYLSPSYIQTTNWQATAPSGATEFAFNLYNASGITPSTVGEITVTVNGATSYPSPTYPQAIKSVGDMGYFDGELLSGIYNTTNGVYTANNYYICSKNPIPCVGGDTIKFMYGGTARVIDFIFFDENGVYLSKSSATNTTETSVTVPTNASYFKFNVSESTTVAITPATAKHICVTINDKYALIVDSKGKNNYKIDIGYSSATQNGISLTTDVEKGTATVNGTATADFGNYLSIESSNRIIRKGSYVLSSNVVGSSTTYGLGFGYKPIGGGGTNYKWVYDTEVTVEFTTDVIVFPLIQVKSGVTVNNLTFYPMIRPVGTDATYEPYKKSRKYIPISAPLRGLGEVTDVASLSESKVNRKFTKVVYNGTESGWSYFKAYNDYYIVSIPIPSNAKIASALCSHFIYTRAGVPNVGQFTIATNRFVTFGFNADIATTLDEWKARVSENPITVIYELAEPTTESIEPIDVDTFEGVTHISVSDNADMEIEYPTSKVAGIASIGWSKGRRAEYDLEQLKAQMLALQTTIVSTV